MGGKALVPARPQRMVAGGGVISTLEGKTPSNGRFASCLPFSGICPATKGAYPLGTPADRMVRLARTDGDAPGQDPFLQT